MNERRLNQTGDVIVEDDQTRYYSHLGAVCCAGLRAKGDDTRQNSPSLR